MSKGTGHGAQSPGEKGLMNEKENRRKGEREIKQYNSVLKRIC
jgi:hypothetical protein